MGRLVLKFTSLPLEPSVPGGLISNHLHDHVQAGGELLIHLPAGDFVLQDTALPVVLISGGVGITPMLAMLHALKDTPRPTVFVHADLGRDHHAFREEVNALTCQHPHLRKVVYYTDPTPATSPANTTTNAA